jgi:bifunctional non-homologous end joining protein LigD
VPGKTASTATIDIDGKKLQLSNLDKVYYPAVGFTKAQVIDYYVRIAPAILPHLAERPVTLKRYPEGVKGSYFYQKECPEYRPEWLDTAPVCSRSRGAAAPKEHPGAGSSPESGRPADAFRNVNFCLVNDLPSLVWVVNTASIELHTSLSLGKDPLTPELVVFDLDPGPPATIVECAQVALWLRQIFDGMGLQSFPKTSGSKGLQVYIPLNTPVAYERTKNFAHDQARLLEGRHPELVVSNMTRSLRQGKVLVDWSQNDHHKTTVCVYSLRAREHPTVSAPVQWPEVETTAAALGKHPDPGLLALETGQVIRRWQEFGDLFAPVLELKQELPSDYDRWS